MKHRLGKCNDGKVGEKNVKEGGDVRGKRKERCVKEKVFSSIEGKKDITGK